MSCPWQHTVQCACAWPPTSKVARIKGNTSRGMSDNGGAQQRSGSHAAAPRAIIILLLLASQMQGKPLAICGRCSAARHLLFVDYFSHVRPRFRTPQLNLSPHTQNPPQWPPSMLWALLSVPTSRKYEATTLMLTALLSSTALSRGSSGTEGSRGEGRRRRAGFTRIGVAVSSFSV